MKDLKIKVCGMRNPENILGVAASMPDYIGLIFYEKSKRFVGFEPNHATLASIPALIKKVGVFVDELQEKVVETSLNWNLDAVQLHGNESPEYCREIQEKGWMVFKAFAVDENFNFEVLTKYCSVCDYFLFDTKAQLPGGTGHKFNWQLLEKYSDDTPFFLSGGIGANDIEGINNIKHKSFFGVDINSGFEISPGIKKIEMVNKFVNDIRNL